MKTSAATADVSLLSSSSSSGQSRNGRHNSIAAEAKKKSTTAATLALKDDSHQSGNLHRKSVQSVQLQPHKPSNSGSCGSSKLQNSTTNKNLSGVNKKSSEVRGAGVKESHKKPSSSVDKDRMSRVTTSLSSAGDKKINVTKVSSLRKQSSGESKKSGPGSTKTEANKASDTVDNNCVRQSSRAEDSSRPGRVHPRTIEKVSSSVSLVRKKFERKIESNSEQSSPGSATPQSSSDKKPSHRVPRVKISQNLFVQGDTAAAASTATANAKKKSENEDDKLPANDHNNSHRTPTSKGHSTVNAKSLESVSSLNPAPEQQSLDTSSSSDIRLVPSSSSTHSPTIIHPDSHVDEFDADTSNLIIDDEELVETVPDTGHRLETELPESPCYRSPLLSDSESEEQMTSRQQLLEAFVGEEPSLRNKLLTNLVNKRSESDGIVCLDRPRPEMSVRRCESIDNAIDLVNRDEEHIPEPSTNLFPQNIKTVTPATIMKGPDDYTAGLQETVYLRTHYFGNPEPRVIWFKGGRRINQNEERVKIRTYPGESTLVIRDLRADDSGKYEIQIENEVGNDCCSASLCVEGPPEPPGGRPYITTIDVDALRLTLAWYGSTFDGGSMLTGYIIEMSSWPISTDSQPPEPTDWSTVSSKCHSTSYKVKNLDPEREYIFRIRAQNIHGQSCPGKVSEPVSFMKFEEDFEEDEQEHDSDEEEFESPFEHRHVTLEDGSVFKENFEIYEELGRGRFGVVFKVRDIETKEVFAAKFVRCRKQEEREKCKEEINIMNGLDHRRLLQLAAAYETPREVIMIMEFIGGGELFEKVVADDFTLTEHDCVLFMRQICQAIGYMHQKDIVHLDLKPENILCKSKKSHQIKIIDFGLTRKLKPGEDVRILFGTPEFVSPEVISYEPVSASSDMWSVGVVCYVLLSGLSPFMGESDVETFANITGLNYDFDDEAFEHISEDAKDFIQKLLVKDQRRRLKALECLKHPWLDHRDTVERSRKEINTDKLKSFLMRRRWQKAAHAIRALGRFTSLGFKHDAKDAASSIALSTQSADF